MNNILIVDDMPVNRKILIKLIKNCVENVVAMEAENGQEALAKLRSNSNSNSISLVVLDIMMPVKDGLQVLKEMKQDPVLVNIPVIMYTAMDDKSNLEKALSLGALDYFTKPLNEEQMKITLPLKIRNALLYHEQKIEIVRLYDEIKEELERAKKLQKSLVSKNGALGYVQISGKYYPCDEIGGDFYSCVTEKGKNWFIIADVAGHGISAAMVSAMLKVVFNNSIKQCEKPEQVLQQINKTMLEVYGDSDARSFTAFVGCLDGDRLHVANAGHPYPLLFHAETKEVQEINLNGLLLGMFENIEVEHDSYAFQLGDCILLYTDGIFDKGNAYDFADWGKVKNYCSKHISSLLNDSDGFVEDMLEYFASEGYNEGINKNGFIDDAAILLVKRTK